MSSQMKYTADDIFFVHKGSFFGNEWLCARQLELERSDRYFSIFHALRTTQQRKVCRQEKSFIFYNRRNRMTLLLNLQ